MRTKLAETSQIPEGKCIIVSLPDGREIALFHIEGHYYALNNSCPHQGGPLGEGKIEGCQVTCPWHAWHFDIATGECLNMPGEAAESIPLLIENGTIYLSD